MVRAWMRWLILAGLIGVAGAQADRLVERSNDVAARPLGDTAELSTFTDAQGHFRFDGLHSSSHLLRVDPAGPPAKLHPAEPPAVLTLSPGVSQTWAVAPAVAIHVVYHGDGAQLEGTLFHDRDGDRNQGAGEAGLPGVRIIDPSLYQYFVPGNDNDVFQRRAGLFKFACAGACGQLPRPVFWPLI